VHCNFPSNKTSVTKILLVTQHNAKHLEKNSKYYDKKISSFPIVRDRSNQIQRCLKNSTKRSLAEVVQKLHIMYNDD
jgi:hypothetical protein